jgi:hypothetical protein
LCTPRTSMTFTMPFIQTDIRAFELNQMLSLHDDLE